MRSPFPIKAASNQLKRPVHPKPRDVMITNTTLISKISVENLGMARAYPSHYHGHMPIGTIRTSLKLHLRAREPATNELVDS